MIQKKVVERLLRLEKIPNQETQHCFESKSIEMANMKTLSIQFVSIAEVIQARIRTSSLNCLSSDVSSSHLGRVVP
jgi:hypothetical protein